MTQTGGKLNVRARVAMDFTGHGGRVVDDPIEAVGVAIEEGQHWRVWIAYLCFLYCLSQVYDIAEFKLLKFVKNIKFEENKFENKFRNFQERESTILFMFFMQRAYNQRNHFNLKNIYYSMQHLINARKTLKLKSKVNFFFPWSRHTIKFVIIY